LIENVVRLFRPLTSKVATRSHTKRRPTNVGRTLRRRQLARHGASSHPTSSIQPRHPRPPAEKYRHPSPPRVTDPGPSFPLLPFPAQFMRVGAVAVGLGYGAVMGMFSGLVRSRSPASSAPDPSPGRDRERERVK
jgi:hypothetical protein